MDASSMLITSGDKYQIKGCAGQGGFAQVFKAYLNSNPDDVVALKPGRVLALLTDCTSTVTTAMERRRTKTRVDDDRVDDASRGGRK
ncbi:hypothetical protein OROHE_025246 [Orobanche hederae]